MPGPTAESPAPTQPAISAPSPTASAAGVGSDQLTEYFNTGGACISDVWNSSVPYSEALYQEMVQYCSAHQQGDWANGADPLDTSQYGDTTPSSEEGSDRKFTEEDRQRCLAMDSSTASSGEIQWCALNGYPSEGMIDYPGPNQ
ncbi:hypothetical protein [Kocuria massiliensis]|uniref:hypothetical protein n=1 Tax=Kocuria massiliensis TaxID=1926282 RepID=UPI0022B9874C|nr:hypothetical protein [Kocuria massiliensis]